MLSNKCLKIYFKKQNVFPYKNTFPNKKKNYIMSLSISGFPNFKHYMTHLLQSILVGLLNEE